MAWVQPRGTLLGRGLPWAGSPLVAADSIPAGHHWELRPSCSGADAASLTGLAVSGQGLGAAFGTWALYTGDGAAVPQQGEDLDAFLWKMVAVGDLQSQGFAQTDQAPPQSSKRGECPAGPGIQPTCTDLCCGLS